MNKKIIFLLIIILMLSTYLRLSNIDLVTISSDELGFYNRAKNIIENKELVFDAISDDYNEAFGPFMFYLFSIPMIFSKDYLFVISFVAILNVLAVLLCFTFARKFFNERVALISSALFAVSPWSIFYSRILFNVGAIPVFTLLFFYSLFSIIINNKQKFLILMFISYAFILQIHLSALAFLPLFLVPLIYHKKKINFKFLGYGIISFLLLLTPFIYYNLKNNLQGFKDVIFFTGFQPANTFITNFVEAIGIPVMLATNYFGKYMFGSLNMFNSNINFLFNIIIYLIVLLFIFGFIYLVRYLIKFKNFKKDNYKKYLLLFLWTAIPIILLIIRNKNISPHYYEILFPVQFIVIALFLDKLINYFKKYNKVIYFSYIIIIILVLSQAVFWLGFLNFVDKEGGTNGTYGIPYKYKLEAVNYIIDDAKNKNINLISFNSYPEDYDYLFSLRNIKPNYIIINSSEEFKNLDEGYMVIDTFSRYGLHMIGDIPKKEVEFFKNLEGKRIKHLVVVKK